MTLIRITKKFEFEMAHALLGYDGPCKNIHGHSYKLYVTIIGNKITDANSPKNGMVIDFSQLKSIVKKSIIAKFDHSLVLNKKITNEIIKNNKKPLGNLILLPYQPTCENLIIDFATRIKKKLPDNVKLFCLKLKETESSYTEWYAEDNK
jgi:6-pyruvoyltetrahydropterin/6-carboxytetrahydropterin synthase